MAKHQFGVMEKEPIDTQRFDEYEPYKYNFISIDDDYIEPILVDLKNIDCYYHTLLNKSKGLDYCGITLIPPKSLDTFIKILLCQDNSKYNDLINLAKYAKEFNKYIIHFGI